MVGNPGGVRLRGSICGLGASSVPAWAQVTLGLRCCLERVRRGAGVCGSGQGGWERRLMLGRLEGRNGHKDWLGFSGKNKSQSEAGGCSLHKGN